MRRPYPAKDVHVTGTFDDWGKTVQLNQVGDVWEKEVDLPSADETIYYKFVVDDKWIVDDAAPKTDDGHWNINNILRPEHIKRKQAVRTISPSRTLRDVYGVPYRQYQHLIYRHRIKSGQETILRQC